MPKDRFQVGAAVHLFLIKDNQILLAKRANTGFGDGLYGIPQGHIEAGESPTQAMIREAQEEIGVEILPQDLKMVLNVYSKIELTYSCWFFTTKKYSGEIINAEPDKCAEIKFYPLDKLPENIIPYIKKSIECYQKGITFYENGF